MLDDDARRCPWVLGGSVCVYMYLRTLDVCHVVSSHTSFNCSRSEEADVVSSCVSRWHTSSASSLMRWTAVASSPLLQCRSGLRSLPRSLTVAGSEICAAMCRKALNRDQQMHTFKEGCLLFSLDHNNPVDVLLHHDHMWFQTSEFFLLLFSEHASFGS